MLRTKMNYEVTPKMHSPLKFLRKGTLELAIKNDNLIIPIHFNLEIIESGDDILFALNDLMKIGKTELYELQQFVSDNYHILAAFKRLFFTRLQEKFNRNSFSRYLSENNRKILLESNCLTSDERELIAFAVDYQV